jgi:hypothetical protein
MISSSKTPQSRLSPVPDKKATKVDAPSGSLSFSAVHDSMSHDNGLFFRFPLSPDSSVALSEANKAPSSWSCSQCSYLNVDSKYERCALCGSKNGSSNGNQREKKRDNDTSQRPSGGYRPASRNRLLSRPDVDDGGDCRQLLEQPSFPKYAGMETSRSTAGSTFFSLVEHYPKVGLLQRTCLPIQQSCTVDRASILDRNGGDVTVRTSNRTLLPSTLPPQPPSRPPSSDCPATSNRRISLTESHIVVLSNPTIASGRPTIDDSSITSSLPLALSCGEWSGTGDAAAVRPATKEISNPSTIMQQYQSEPGRASSSLHYYFYSQRTMAQVNNSMGSKPYDEQETLNSAAAQDPPVRDLSWSGSNAPLTRKLPYCCYWHWLDHSLNILTTILVIGGTVALVVLLVGVFRGDETAAAGRSPDLVEATSTKNDDTVHGANGTKWERIFAIIGDPMDHLGSSVSVGGPVGNWIAMAGSNFIQVVRYASPNVVEPVGGTIVFENNPSMAPPRVSLSAERRRLVATTNDGRLIVYERGISDKDGDWESVFAFDATVTSRDSEVISAPNAIVPTCGDISGSGLVVAGGALIQTTKGAFAAIQVWELENGSFVGQPKRTYFEVASDTTGRSIDVALSYDGTVLSALTNYYVTVYRRQSEPTERWVNESPFLHLENGDASIVAIALSGDGLVLALSSANGVATIYFYVEQGDGHNKWISVDVLAVTSTKLALSYTGETLLVGRKKDETYLGQVAVWRQQMRSSVENVGKYIKVDETSGSVPSSNFGSSVSLPKNRQWDIWAVGASTEGKYQNGQVDVYEKFVSQNRQP